MTENTSKEKRDRWEINLEAFDDDSYNPFEADPNRKFNLKIRNEDLVLLDAFAAYYKIPRSTLINHLLLVGLQRQLLDTDQGGLDTHTLIAYRADKKMSRTSFRRNAYWTEDLLLDRTKEAAIEILEASDVPFSEEDYPMEYRHSEAFNALDAFFNGLDNK